MKEKKKTPKRKKTPRDAAMRIKCPKCGSNPGRDCRENGEWRKAVHVARIGRATEDRERRNLERALSKSRGSLKGVEWKELARRNAALEGRVPPRAIQAPTMTRFVCPLCGGPHARVACEVVA